MTGEGNVSGGGETADPFHAAMSRLG